MPLSTYDFRKNWSVEICAVCKGLTRILPNCSKFLRPILMAHTKIVGSGYKLREGVSEYGPTLSKFVVLLWVTVRVCANNAVGHYRVS